MNFVALDFETANSQRASVCSLGIVVVENGRIIKEAYWLVKPKNFFFDPYNTYIHGITAEDVKDEPEFDILWPEIKPYLENRVLIAHNASFDLSVLRHILDEYQIPYPSLSYSCSWIISKKHWPDLLSHKLNFISEHLGIQFKHHNALEDALACAKIVLHILEESNAASLSCLLKNHGLTMGQLYPGGYKSTSPKSGNFKTSTIKPGVTSFDRNNPFFSKNIVFTGTLHSMSRKNAMQKIVDRGGFCPNEVNTETDYLVVGSQDYWKFEGSGKSSKLKKAEVLKSSGTGIMIISESDFMSML